MGIEVKGNRQGREPKTMLTINGETKLLVVWSRETGIPKNVLRARVKSGDTDDRLLRPVAFKLWTRREQPAPVPAPAPPPTENDDLDLDDEDTELVDQLPPQESPLATRDRIEVTALLQSPSLKLACARYLRSCAHRPEPLTPLTWIG